MIKISHTPMKYANRCYTIEGDNLDELINESLTRVRDQSLEFYRKELKRNLLATGQSIIDVHAGQGNFYTVILTS